MRKIANRYFHPIGQMASWGFSYITGSARRGISREEQSGQDGGAATGSDGDLAGNCRSGAEACVVAVWPGGCRRKIRALPGLS